MANKSTNLNFNIKVNGKELDLTKTSVKEFTTVIKQAKTELNNLPLNDPRYKVLAKDIKSAEEAWIAAKKGATDFNDEMEKGDEQVATYKKQIREATEELFRIEQQFGKNSKAYTDQKQKIAALRDAQEEFTRTTQDLDDTLAAIPGPIGRIGQGMQMLEGVTQNVGSAMNKLGINFKSFEGILKASGVGAFVLVVATLVAAVIKAAKSFQPLQDAFAGLQDAVGAIFDAFKPFTDFILKVFVGAINLAAKALTGLASIFGGVNRGLNQMSKDLEVNIKKQETLISNYGSFLSKNYNELLNLQLDFNKKKLDLLNDEKKTDEQKKKEIQALDIDYFAAKRDLQNAQNKELRDQDIKFKNTTLKDQINFIDNRRTFDKKSAEAELQLQKDLINSEVKQLNGRIVTKMTLIKMLKESDEKYYSDTIKALEESIKDEKKIIDNKYKESALLAENFNSELNKKQREYNREDRNLIIQNNLERLAAVTEQNKDEQVIRLQQAYNSINILKEQHRQELEQIRLNQGELSEVYKSAKQKQEEQLKAANEKLRKEIINYDAYIIQLEIDKQNRLATEVGKGTQEYFDARRTIIQKEFEQELLLADGNESKIEDARTNHWKKLLELDKEGVQAQISQLETELNSLYEGTARFYEKQREIERDNYKLAQLEAQGNYDKLEALRLEHERKMKEIDIAELQAKLDFEKRRADTLLPIFGGYFKEQKRLEEEYYKLRVKAAGDNADAIAAIEAEHAMSMRQLRMAELQTFLDFSTKIAEVTSSVFTAVQAVNDARMAKELKNAEGNAAAQEEIKKKYFEKSKKNQIAQAYIATFQAAVQAYAAMAGIPVVGPALGAIAAAAAIVAGLANVAKIKATTYEDTSGGGGTEGGAKPAMPNYLRNYADGGMIGGRRHAEGGTLIEAEKGEAIMTRGAVTMFAPLLSMMNQMGGGAAFAPSLMTTSFDKPTVSTPSEDNKPMIIKSYVVSNELTNEQQRQARLKDLSTL